MRAPQRRITLFRNLKSFNHANCKRADKEHLIGVHNGSIQFCKRPLYFRNFSYRSQKRRLKLMIMNLFFLWTHSNPLIDVGLRMRLVSSSQIKYASSGLTWNKETNIIVREKNWNANVKCATRWWIFIHITNHSSSFPLYPITRSIKNCYSYFPIYADITDQILKNVILIPRHRSLFLTKD